MNGVSKKTGITDCQLPEDEQQRFEHVIFNTTEDEVLRLIELMGNKKLIYHSVIQPTYESVSLNDISIMPCVVGLIFKTDEYVNTLFFDELESAAFLVQQNPRETKIFKIELTGVWK